MGETPFGVRTEVYEAQSSSVSMAFRSVSCTLSLPIKYQTTHVPGSPEEFKSDENNKSGNEKYTNRANGIVKHPRTRLPHCTVVMACMKTICLPSSTKLFASINKRIVLTVTLPYNPATSLKPSSRYILGTFVKNGRSTPQFYSFSSQSLCVTRLPFCSAYSEE